MHCKKPFTKGMSGFPCGQCLPCRINRHRLWAHRIMLEATCHKKTSFVTLTYNKECVPSDGSVVPRDLQLYIKRLRHAKTIDGTVPHLRYFGCGEYGEKYGRPHYHLALFGLGVEDAGVIGSSWGGGNVVVGTLTRESAAYIAQYVTKKLTAKNDERLNGKHPEFARMSLRPGIGALAVPEIARALSGGLLLREGGNLLDVPGVLQHGDRRYPLGRYLQRRVRTACGLDEKGPEIKEYERSLEVSALFKNYLNAGGTGSLKHALLWNSEGKIRQIEGKYRIFKGAKKL